MDSSRFLWFILPCSRFIGKRWFISWGPLYKAAKAAFDEAGLQKLPKVKELDAEFSELLTKKKAAYPDYSKARNEMQELVRAQKNVERFFAEEKDTIEKAQTR